ncbi:amidohydrolase family protein [Marinigracilibium pacificum]|uniref:Membrane dipeptidase (Peptidase family M19) n=1 Tax=Marinigracilibium pacificum TaxID=2729599 RepID=A0A848J264_9BACT|nr:hypothetical protein [Marinigracilibium pacificum]NMM47282.1 hypothetical protein [Marinigracilibium pacificum]
MFSDLHNHNHSRTYLWLWFWQEKHKRKGHYNPWTVVASNMKARNKARMASAYGQADPVKLWNGNVRLTFNSLYPIEKGFFKSTFFHKKHTDIKSALISFASHHHLPLRDILQAFVMRLPFPVINYIQSNDYKYWKSLNEEYKFVISKDNIKTRNHIHFPGIIRSVFESRRKRRNKYSELLDAEATYAIPKNKNELNQFITEDKITMVLTIEGMHSLGTDEGDLEQWKKNVDHVKKEWIHPIFFITFAHHFDNKLCGHAHSFPKISEKLIDQSKNLNEKFNEDGKVLLRKLLSIDESCNPAPSEGYRILIDVKHMAAKSREYYYEIVKECLNKNDQIPVIASHCGYSGRKTLKELIENQKKETDDYFVDDKYYAWNINVCDEDIEMIFETEGLFGLSFDQRIVGVPKKQKETGGRNTITSLWLNIKAVVDVIFNSSKTFTKDKSLIWDRISLGSDYEGFIDPVNEYPTAIEYKNFKADLIDAIDNERISNGGSIYGLNSREMAIKVVDNICYHNAANFVKKWYPTK